MDGIVLNGFLHIDGNVGHNKDNGQLGLLT